MTWSELISRAELWLREGFWSKRQFMVSAILERVKGQLSDIHEHSSLVIGKFARDSQWTVVQRSS